MKAYYTDEKNTLILLALLKANSIKKVIASPGATNISIVRSMQNDPFFEIYSSVDERSAAYMACGLAAESGEPVVLSCTGATAPRNYVAGLTEAYYSKLPVLAIASTLAVSKVGHHIAQVTDRDIMPADTVKHNIYLPPVKDDDDWRACEIQANRAILELTRHGGGPVQINLATTYSRNFSVEKLPEVRLIRRIARSSESPDLPKGRIAIFAGSHTLMGKELTEAIDNFCASNDSVVFCDHTSGYYGKYKVVHSLSSSQRLSVHKGLVPDLTIHIGEITGDYSTGRIIGKSVWRVSEDGELRDTFNKLQCIFEMPEVVFFNKYTTDTHGSDTYLSACKTRLARVCQDVPELPFSNIWIAQKSHNQFPEGSVVHFGILNSLRAWNFFDLSQSVRSTSNVGGFGIDGCVSSLIGASLANKERIYFAVVGDLAFFYDMNSIGNRHLGNNVRILLINNGKGTEFRNFNHPAAVFGESADDFHAAGGHFGNKSRKLVKNYSENLGFEYLSASNKEEYAQVCVRFFSQGKSDKPLLLEVFTDSSDESKALEIIYHGSSAKSLDKLGIPSE